MYQVLSVCSARNLGWEAARSMPGRWQKRNPIVCCASHRPTRRPKHLSKPKWSSAGAPAIGTRTPCVTSSARGCWARPGLEALKETSLVEGPRLQWVRGRAGWVGRAGHTWGGGALRSVGTARGRWDESPAGGQRVESACGLALAACRALVDLAHARLRACVAVRRPDARSTSASATKGTMQQQRENQRRKAARALASHRLRRAASLR